MDDMEQKSEGKVNLEFSKTTLWQIISGVLGVLLVISIFTDGFGFGSDSSPTGGVVVNNQPSQPQLPSLPTGPVDVSADDDPVLGEEDAPVTIIEFSDFQCPFCKSFKDQTFGLIQENYIDTGKVKFVYRDFPLSSIHSMAQKGAEASECADDQGKFWEYHDVLFEKQQEWTTIGASKLKEYAANLGLDSGDFDSCLDSGKYEDEVNQDLSDGSIVGVQGTPSFFVNGVQLSGAQPYASFQAAIEQALNS